MVVKRILDPEPRWRIYGAFAVAVLFFAVAVHGGGPAFPSPLLPSLIGVGLILHGVSSLIDKEQRVAVNVLRFTAFALFFGSGVAFFVLRATHH